MDRSQYINKMEHALIEVNKIKQQLQKNAAEVKSEIHSGISRQLEALRNREVWLLNQVELIQNMKDEVLHLQQARLNKMLGVAQSGLPDSLGCELDSADLNPDENPWIIFKYDSAKLRASITSYGRVESTNRPHAVFVQPGHPAKSLPPHFEDYDDADHHILYKTVEGVTKSSQNTMVTFTLPNLSTSSKDWLAYSSTSTSSSGASSNPRFSFPVLSSSNQDWLTAPKKDKSTDSISPNSSVCSGSWQISNEMNKKDTDASIQRWLKDIKQNPAEDDEDFEVISKKEFLGMERCQRKVSLSSSHSAPDLNSINCDTWLQTENKPQTSMSNAIKLPSHLEHSSTETWLCRKWKRNAKVSCEEKCGQTGQFEIENICDYLNKKIWIKSAPCVENQQMEVCQANEPCQGPDCCVATSHCFYSIQQDTLLTQDTSQWLLNGGKNVSPTTTIETKLMDEFRVPPVDDKMNMWLKGGNIQQRNLEDLKAKPIQMEEKVWIKEDSFKKMPESTTPFSVSSSWNKVMTFHSQIDGNQWLLQESEKKREKVKEDKSEKNREKVKEDNPWILKSSVTSEIPEEANQWIYTKMEDVMDILQ